MGRLFAVSDNVGTISSFIGVKVVTLTHTGALTAYQKSITIAHETAMQAAFGDIRFVTLAGAHIPYWIESKTDGATADVWIKNDYASGDTLVLMYYGNAGLSDNGSLSDVFIEYFDKNSTAGWTISGATVTTSGDYLRIYNPTTSIASSVQRYDLTLPNKFIMETRLKNTSLGGVDNGYIMLNDASLSHRKSLLRIPYGGNNSEWWYGYNGDNSAASGGAYSEGTEYIMKTTVDETDHITGVSHYLMDTSRSVLSSAISIDDVLGSPTQTDGIFLGDSGGAFNIDQYIKWIIFREYTETEPTYIIGPEMHQRRTPQYV